MPDLDDELDAAAAELKAALLAVFDEFVTRAKLAREVDAEAAEFAQRLADEFKKL